VRALTAIRRDIVAQWAAIHERAGTLPEALQALPKSPKILGSGTKTEKGEAKGIVTAIVYASPATEAFPEGDGRTMCGRATAGCEAACLGKRAGRMVMKPIKRSRLWKTTLFLGAPSLFRELLAAEIAAFERSAVKAGYRPAVRIDGSTDIGLGARMAPMFPGVAFYDYTKVPARALKHAAGGFARNYHVTFSYSGANLQAALQVLSAGGSVAVVFSTHPQDTMPSGTLWGHHVLNGDEHDARFLDPKGGLVVGLSFKQAAQRDAALQAALREGFVLDDGMIDSELAA